LKKEKPKGQISQFFESFPNERKKNQEITHLLKRVESSQNQSPIRLANIVHKEVTSIMKTTNMSKNNLFYGENSYH